MEDAIVMVLVYGSLMLMGIPIGRVFTGPWLIFLSAILIAILAYLYYVTGNVFNVAKAPGSPEGGQLAAMIPYLWLGIAGPILVGAWVAWVVTKLLRRSKTTA